MRRVAIFVMLFSCTLSCSTDSRTGGLSTQGAKIERPDEPIRIGEPATSPDTGEPALHAIQDERLRQVMKQIDSLVYAQMLGKVDLSRERKLKTEEIAGIARALADNEKAVIATLPSLHLNADETSVFSALADKLRDGALAMETLAEQDRWQDLPAVMTSITSTCTACHALFRKTRSLMEKCKDPQYTC
ncbi:MAG: hypothetical protein ACU84J_03210 [Gammaproteobacteria bacterium]